MTTSKQENFDSYVSSETARKYKKSASDALSKVDRHMLDKQLAAVQRDGYVIIPNVLSAEQLHEIRQEVSPLLDSTGRNDFEGALTQRLYSVIAKTFVCNPLVEHPLILALLDSLFQPGYLLSQLQVINILPGESQQAIHTDDAFYALPRPRQALGAATVGAIDDFTNGERVAPATSNCPGKFTAKCPQAQWCFFSEPCGMAAARTVPRPHGWLSLRSIVRATAVLRKTSAYLYH